MVESAAKKQRIDGKTAKIAVAGAGWWSQGWHLPHLQRNSLSEITAIVEPCQHPRSTLNPDMKTIEQLGELYRVPVFKNIDDFLASDVAKATDGVIVASNHATHHEIGMKSLKAGLHVLMEKPMTTDPQQAHELVEAAAASDRIFIVNNTANFREQAKRAHDLVKAGEIGKIRNVQCYMGSALLWLFENPENPNWTKPSGTMVGNGFGWGQLSHTLAWVYMVTGLTPTNVFCQMTYSEKTGADLFDTAIVTCSSGATICVQGCAALPFKSYTESGKQIDNKIFGSEGMLLYSGDDTDPKSGELFVRRNDLKEHRFDGFYFEEYDAEGDGPASLQSFLKGILGENIFNGADATVGLKAVQTIDAMYRSAQSGKLEACQESAGARRGDK